jgi:gluconate kinase
LVKTFSHGKICLQQHNAFIKSINIFFNANHGLHPKFDIQCLNKVINPTIEDQAMWLTNVQVQLLFNLEKTQRQYKENIDEHREK